MEREQEMPSDRCIYINEAGEAYTILAFANFVSNKTTDGYHENFAIIHPVGDPHALYVMRVSLFRDTFKKRQVDKKGD